MNNHICCTLVKTEVLTVLFTSVHTENIPPFPAVSLIPHNKGIKKKCLCQSAFLCYVHLLEGMGSTTNLSLKAILNQAHKQKFGESGDF